MSRKSRAFIPTNLEDIDLGPNKYDYQGLGNVCGVPKNDTNFYQVLEYPNGTRVDLGYQAFLTFPPKKGYIFPWKNTFAVLDPDGFQSSVQAFDESTKKLAPLYGGPVSYGLLKVPVPDICLQSQTLAG